ncbi:MAG: ABC transporter permease [Comamonadaceae bacterium]|nr:ABC transporter permease [Comamonadaceae bacterium]
MHRFVPVAPPAPPRLSTHGTDSGSFGQHAHEWWLLWWSNLYLGSSMLVLLCRPGRHWWRIWQVVTAQVYARLRWSLLGFLLIAYILGSVATQITQQTLQGFGLAHFTPSLMVRILLVEVVPLAAALVAAIKLTIPLGAELAMLRHRKHLARLEAAGIDALRVEFLPRLLMGVYAAIMLAAMGSAAVMVTLYLNIYGYTLAGLEVFTHAFGRTMTPLFTFIFAAKAIAFGYIVALIPLTAAFTDPRYGLRRDSELATLARMLALLTLVEVLSLIANYY